VVGNEPSGTSDDQEYVTASGEVNPDWIASLRYAIPISMVIGALLGLAAGAYAYLRPPSFRAQVTLASVGAARPSIPGGIAANLLSNSLGGTGIQPTAVFIAKLAKLPGVLRAVLQSPLVGSPTRSIDAAIRGPATVQIGIERLGRLLLVAVDDRTGILTVSVVARDSMLARNVVLSSVREIRSAFRDASRAQAEAQRDAQQVRVENASTRLREAERALFEFRAANRMIPETSPLSLVLKRLERENSLSESLYSQAVGEREAATAKVLEQSPSLIELDALPPELPREPRGTVIVTISVTIVMTLMLVALIVGRAAWRSRSTRPTPR